MAENIDFRFIPRSMISYTLLDEILSKLI